MDLGGACGAHYFYAKALLGGVDLDWRVVETTAMAAAGAEFACEGLSFFKSGDIDKASLGGADVLYMSGMLQYLDDPLAYLEHVLDMGAAYVYIGRCMMTTEDAPIFTVQKARLSDYGEAVSPSDSVKKHKAVPIVLVPKGKVLNLLAKDHVPVCEFQDNSGRLRFWDNVWAGGMLYARK